MGSETAVLDLEYSLDKTINKERDEIDKIILSCGESTESCNVRNTGNDEAGDIEIKATHQKEVAGRDKGIEYNPIRIYINELRKIKRLGEDEQNYLFKRYRATRDEDAKNKLIKSNLRLVINIAKRVFPRFRDKAIDFLDIIQYGNIGLMKAVEKYDIDKINEKTGKPYKFSTYAVWWIKQVIFRNIGENMQDMRLPAHMAEKISRYNKIYNKLEQKDCSEPQREEIAEELKMPAEKIKEIEKLRSIRFHSLESRIYGEGDDAVLLKDRIKDRNAVVPSKDFLLNDNVDYLLKTVKELKGINDRDKTMFILMYGFDNGYNKRTLRDLAYISKISRERVRQVTDNVREKLRKKVYKELLV